MERYEEEGEDSDNETDPEQLLNEWLGELDSLTVVSFLIISAIIESWRKINEMSMDCRKDR